MNRVLIARSLLKAARLIITSGNSTQSRRVATNAYTEFLNALKEKYPGNAVFINPEPAAAAPTLWDVHHTNPSKKSLIDSNKNVDDPRFTEYKRILQKSEDELTEEEKKILDALKEELSECVIIPKWLHDNLKMILKNHSELRAGSVEEIRKVMHKVLLLDEELKEINQISVHEDNLSKMITSLKNISEVVENETKFRDKFIKRVRSLYKDILKDIREEIKVLGISESSLPNGTKN